MDTEHSSTALLVAVLGNRWQGRSPDLDGASHVEAATSTLVDVLGRVGVGEAAARATLNRAVTRGLLARTRRGRQSFFSLTPETRRLLAAGAQRLHHDPAVRDAWDGHWTLLTYSLPESRRDERHRLRTRLQWEGFGLLRDGLWLSPGDVDVAALGSDLGLLDDLTAFRGAALPPTEVDQLVQQAWDLDHVAERYHAFLRRWDASPPGPDLPDELSRQVVLVADWRDTVLGDPLLPRACLPDGWPAEAARRVFDTHYAALDRAAADQFAEALVAPTPATT